MRCTKSVIVCCKENKALILSLHKSIQWTLEFHKMKVTKNFLPSEIQVEEELYDNGSLIISSGAILDALELIWFIVLYNIDKLLTMALKRAGCKEMIANAF